jgi:hypothetical protein
MSELLCLKNASAQISLFFTSLAPMAIEKIKILGAVLELPAANPAHLPQKLGQMG